AKPHKQGRGPSIEIVFALMVLFVLAVVAGVIVLTRRDRRLPPEGATKERPVRPASVAPERADAIAGRAPSGLADRVRSMFRGGQAGEQTWRELEEALVRADVGPKAAAAIVERVRATYRPPADPAEVLAQEVAATFGGDES